MKNFFTALFIIFLVFQNVLITLVNIPHISYWDEAVFILVFAAFILKMIQKFKIKKIHFRIIFFVLITILIGLIGNLLFMYQKSAMAIIMDIVGYIKFPLIFVAFRELKYDRKMLLGTRKYATPFFKLMVIIMFVLGVISIFWNIGLSNGTEMRYGFYTYRFLFNHPTSLVMASVFIFCIMNAVEKKKENLIFEIMIMLIIIFTFRSKGFAIVGVSLFIKYNKDYIYKHRYFIMVSVVLIAFLLARDRLQEYMSYSGSARASLYEGAFQLMKDCFPVGSGFATFASHLSARIGIRSLIYKDITIPGAFVNNIATPLVGDTGYPYYLGQLGVIGFIFFGLILYNIFLEIIETTNNIPAFCLFLYLLVGLTSETTLINYGVEAGIILSVLLSFGEEKNTSKKITLGIRR